MNNGNSNGNNTFDQDSVFDFELFTKGMGELVKFGKGMGWFVDSTAKFEQDAGSLLELLTNNQHDIATYLRDTQTNLRDTQTNLLDLTKHVQRLNDRCKRLEKANGFK